MQLDILTPGKKIFSGAVESATFPGVEGQFQLLNSHAPLISLLKEGNLKYKTTIGEEIVLITGGLVEVNNNTIIVLADGIKE
jgi:F-type H+-transporting ATPase subunit epsilon